MIMSMLKSSNESMRMLASVHKDMKTSIIGGNLNEILTYFGIDDFPCNVKTTRLMNMYDQFTLCGIVLELLDVR